MRAPTTIVLRKVAAKSRICSHQRGRGAGMTQTPGWGLARSCCAAREAARRDAGATLLVNGLQFLAGLEADGLAGRYGHFGAGARVPSNAGLARTHVEDAKTAQFNAVAIR